MSFIKSKEYEIYKQHNKSLWFLLPLLQEGMTNHRDFLFQSNLLNTYLKGFKYDGVLTRPLYIHYLFSDSEEFKSLEEYMTMDLGGNKYIDTLDISEKEVVFCYDITNTIPYPDNSLKELEDNPTSDYDVILAGKYSQISTKHKLRILNFFYEKGCSYDNFLRLLFGRNPILWEMRKKHLGCMLGDNCKCTISTVLQEFTDGSKKTMLPVLHTTQPYKKCSYYNDWVMPKNVELEEQINLEEETYGKIYAKSINTTIESENS